ncbi:sulfatase family protein [Roseimaritima sediminicola]|uniref:sulfatase family protein n=1 Tax=Roseimaritima sediminicola TaxID=2662066 RepID=UPI001298511E|nr:sulfatase-like hydrolase/transferase [Roseimaritima sediminicola]
MGRRTYWIAWNGAWVAALALLGATLDAQEPSQGPRQPGSAADGDRKPNIVLVFIDDMGWGDFSCFGNPDAETPQIDRMAAEGLAFEQFYVNSPICSPSRVAISTGQYPQRWNITSFLNNRKSNRQRGMAQWLDPAAPMLARTLQQAGYATGHFGKWHMGGQRDVDDAPPISRYGFDASLTNFEGMGAKLLPLTMDENGKVGRIWQRAEILGGPVTWMQRSEITTGFVDAAVEFMQQARQSEQPFYVNVWPDDVHSPFWPPAEEYGVAKEAGKRGLYLAVLEAMDRQLGRLFDFVRDDPRLRENTIILICSDNGPERGAGQAGPFRGFKAQLYEGGIRSSLIVWAPGWMPEAARGTRNAQSVLAAFDLVPSLIEIAGVDPPAQPPSAFGRTQGATPYDGQSLAETLLGQATRSRSGPLFFSRPPDRKQFYGESNLPDLAVRDGKWKLLCDYDGSGAQLYNLDADPGESENLAAKHPERAGHLVDLVTAWYEQTLGSAVR